MQLFDKWLTIMFSGFWSFIGCTLIIMIAASIFEFIYQHTLDFIKTLIRGYPPASIINNYNKEEEKK